MYILARGPVLLCVGGVYEVPHILYNKCSTRRQRDDACTGARFLLDGAIHRNYRFVRRY